MWTEPVFPHRLSLKNPWRLQDKARQFFRFSPGANFHVLSKFDDKGEILIGAKKIESDIDSPKRAVTPCKWTSQVFLQIRQYSQQLVFK